MAYADQQMSGNRITAIVIVALIHAGVGYALVTGLAYEAATKIMKKVTTVDIKDEVKPPPPPPPRATPPTG
jgi:protein TonB